MSSKMSELFSRLSEYVLRQMHRLPRVSSSLVNERPSNEEDDERHAGVLDHVLKQIYRLPGYPTNLAYERLANGDHDEGRDHEKGGEHFKSHLQRLNKYTYVVQDLYLHLLQSSRLLVLLAGYSHHSCLQIPSLMLTLQPIAIPQYLPSETLVYTTPQLQATNITTTALDHLVDIPNATKALVVVTRSEDAADWVKKVRSDWTPYLYIVTTDTNPNATLHVPANNGNETMRYLSFIIDTYDSLPDFIAFRHGHEQSWHQESDAADEVNYLNLTTVRSRGYQNFYCVNDMCKQHVYLAAMQREKEASDGATSKRLSARAGPEVNDAMYDHWLSWFDGIPMPEHITAACCAQVKLDAKSF